MKRRSRLPPNGEGARSVWNRGGTRLTLRLLPSGMLAIEDVAAVHKSAPADRGALPHSFLMALSVAAQAIGRLAELEPSNGRVSLHEVAELLGALAEDLKGVLLSENGASGAAGTLTAAVVGAARPRLHPSRAAARGRHGLAAPPLVRPLFQARPLEEEDLRRELLGLRVPNPGTRTLLLPWEGPPDALARACVAACRSFRPWRGKLPDDLEPTMREKIASLRKRSKAPDPEAYVRALASAIGLPNGWERTGRRHKPK